MLPPAFLPCPLKAHRAREPLAHAAATERLPIRQLERAVRCSVARAFSLPAGVTFLSHAPLWRPGTARPALRCAPSAPRRGRPAATQAHAMVVGARLRALGFSTARRTGREGASDLLTLDSHVQQAENCATSGNTHSSWFVHSCSSPRHVVFMRHR